MPNAPTSSRVRRLLAAGGVVGPVAFVAGWSIGAAVHPGSYSSVDDAISRLAAPGSPVRPLMNSGFVVFGVGVTASALALRQWGGGPAWAAVATTGLATLAVAAAPVDSDLDAAHAAFAGLGYGSLAAAPLLAARPLATQGRRHWSRASALAGIVSGAALVSTLAGPSSGLLQRVGLTVGHAWIAAASVDAMARRDTERRARG